MGTNALFSLLVFGTLAPTLAFWDHTLEDWFSPGDSNWWDAAPWITPDGKLPDGFLDWDNYGEQRETAITEFTNRFLGGNCAQSDTTMSRSLFSCEDFGSATIGPGGTYFIEAAGSGGSKSYFAGDVAVGAEYTLKGPFDDPTAITTIKVYTATGEDLLQIVTFNLSTAGFENPFFIGDVYGASQLIKWVDSTGKTSTIDPKNALTIAPVASTNAPIADDISCIDFIEEITYRFNGGGCDQSDNDKSRVQFSCEDSNGGAAIDAGPYYIEVDNMFGGNVEVGSEYTLNLVGFNYIGVATIKVYSSQDGDLLQTVTIGDMGCSSPLYLFDKFGANEVTEWVETSGRVVTSKAPDAPTNAPKDDDDCIDPLEEITYVFNGGGCDQSDNEMSRDVFSCEDTTTGATIGAGTYYIEATGSNYNFLVTVPNEYFSGNVAVGSEYTLNGDGEFDSLGTATINGTATIKVYTSKDGDLLQTVTINDMSCKNPLFLFDKFGASQVTSWVETSGRVVTSNNGMLKENVESVVDTDISTGADANTNTGISTSADADTDTDTDTDVSTSGDANTITSTGGVAALDTGSSTATTGTVTIAAAFVVVVASVITLI